MRQASLLALLNDDELAPDFPIHEDWMALKPHHERSITFPLKRRFKHHLAFPNVYACGGEMDLAIVTKPRRLLWEIEIKVTAEDWKNDRKKKKWVHPDRHKIARFFYAVPKAIAHLVPKFVPETAGILTLEDGDVSELRPARALCERPVTDPELIDLFESSYYRYWHKKWVEHRIKEREREAGRIVAQEHNHWGELRKILAKRDIGSMGQPKLEALKTALTDLLSDVNRRLGA